MGGPYLPLFPQTLSLCPLLPQYFPLCTIPSPGDACDTPSRQSLPWPLPLPALPLHIYHDRLKLCHDREVPEWAQQLSQQIIKGTGYTKEKGGVKDQRGYRDKLYCVCRKPYTGEFMIRCEECKEWYHGKCVKVTFLSARGVTGIPGRRYSAVGEVLGTLGKQGA